MKATIGIVSEQADLQITPAVKKLVRAAARQTLVCEKYDRSCEISVAFVTSDSIRTLNRDYRDKDTVTDVLSFCDGETDPETGVVLLGDVVICAARAVEQAAEFGQSAEREIAFLTVHSVLHLLGYDHETGAQDEQIMREKQRAVMDGLGLSAPAQ